MKPVIFSKLRVLFILSLVVCMLLGALLTIAQLLGVLFQMPALVVESERLLLRPVIASAAAFGLFSFFASYFSPGGMEADEEAEEI